MGNEEKQGFLRGLKSGVEKLQSDAVEIAKAGASKVAEGSKTGAAALAKGAKVGAEAVVKGAKVSADAVVVGAKSVGDAASGLKDAVTDKSREVLDNAYEKRRALALANLKRLLNDNQDATPAMLMGKLEAELKRCEVQAGSDSDSFTTAAAQYVLTAVELYGDQADDEAGRQRLIDLILVLDSTVSRLILEYGGLALELVAGRVKTAGKIVSIAGKVGGKASKYGKVMKLLGIENPGQQGMTWVIVQATKKTLGDAPDTLVHLKLDEPEHS
jgi:cell division septum initiation protein DivIVA